MKYPLQIQPLEFRDLLIEKCGWSKNEANQYVLHKMQAQFGEVPAELRKKLEEALKERTDVGGKKE